MIALYNRRFFVGAAVALALSLSPSFAGAEVLNTPPSSNQFNTPGQYSIDNPLGSTYSVCGLLVKLFKAAMPIVTAVGVVFIIWSGFLFVLAQGNQKKLKDARRNFYYTIIGLAIFLGAWLLAQVIAATINAIGGGTIISCN